MWYICTCVVPAYLSLVLGAYITPSPPPYYNRQQGNRTCSRPDFWFINSCTELRRHFHCERGCNVVLGDDVPNYVVNPAQITFHQCLITQRLPLCQASHNDTVRLCPCVPII